MDDIAVVLPAHGPPVTRMRVIETLSVKRRRVAVRRFKFSCCYPIKLLEMELLDEALWFPRLPGSSSSVSVTRNHLVSSSTIFATFRVRSCCKMSLPLSFEVLSFFNYLWVS